ncbi:hypothetical protein H9P43_003088 [Blastocladiella emersonii ATCC 22665]|nr:hypothetical protein H9P43_003088 [Blastocladiella emersonii ATCC 22665]
MASPRLKIMITGATGLLGRAVLKEFNTRNLFDAFGTAFSRASGSIAKLDLTDFDAVTAFIEQHRPQAIVHCAAERRPDVAEKDPAGVIKLNVDTTRHLASLCKQRGLFFVYISTDYVFDGARPGIRAEYEVGDATNPLNSYGVSKRDGERAVHDVFAASPDNPDAKYAIVRVPVLYGDTDDWAESAVSVLINVVDAAQAPGAPPAQVDAYSIRYPTYTGDVARALADITQLALVGDGPGAAWPLRDVFHFTSEELWTKYDMCVLFAKLRGQSMANVHAVTQPPPNPTANRPGHVRLSTKKLWTLGIDGKATKFEDYWAKVLTKVKPSL